MKSNRIVASVFLLLFTCYGKVAAQEVFHDGTLLASIGAQTLLEKKSLDAAYAALAALGTAHYFTQQEMEAVYKLNKEFNDYLDSFHEVVAYAAQSYGIYNEMRELIDNISSFIEVVSDGGADGYVAVAISPRRNDIYQDIILETGEILEDIRKVVLGKPESDEEKESASYDEEKKTFKLTEKQRIDILFNIRPKLQILNKKLTRLELLAKYTSLIDVWREIADLSYEVNDKKSIAESCFNKWSSVPMKLNN